MFTINQFDFTEESVRYFSNINHLSKDIRKFFVFLANREKRVFEDLDKIKHTQLLQVISKAFKLPNYNEKHKNLIVDIDFLNRLIKSVSNYILENTKIKEEFIIEVFKLLLLNVGNVKTDNLKYSIMKKINSRIEHLEKFSKIQIYSNKKITRKQELLNDSFKEVISNEDYELFKKLFDNFKFDFNYYKQVTNKNYQFVWYPYGFENYNYHFSFSQIEESKEILEKAKIYKYFIEIKYLLHDWIMASNINLFNKGNVEKTYYIQKDVKDKYIELLLASYETNLFFHGGRKFGSIIIGPSPLDSLKYEYLKDKYSNKIMLKKISWENSNYYLIKVQTYTDSFDFCCGENFIGFKNFNGNEYFIKCFIFKQKTSNVECFSHLGNVCYKTKNMKNFFLFKREQDYFEYHLFNEEDLIYIVQFRIDQIIIKTTTKKLIFKYEDILKKENFNFEI